MLAKCETLKKAFAVCLAPAINFEFETTMIMVTYMHFLAPVYKRYENLNGTENLCHVGMQMFLRTSPASIYLANDKKIGSFLRLQNHGNSNKAAINQHDLVSSVALMNVYFLYLRIVIYIFSLFFQAKALAAATQSGSSRRGVLSLACIRLF